MYMINHICGCIIIQKIQYKIITRATRNFNKIVKAKTLLQNITSSNYYQEMPRTIIATLASVYILVGKVNIN